MSDRLVDLLYALKNKCLASDQEFISRDDVSQSEYQVFLALSRNDAVSCQEVAEKTGLSPSRVSRILDDMVRDGYLERLENPDDRRQKIIRLTANGRIIMNRIQDYRNSCEQKLLDGLAAGEAETVRKAFRSVLDIL